MLVSCVIPVLHTCMIYSISYTHLIASFIHMHKESKFKDMERNGCFDDTIIFIRVVVHYIYRHYCTHSSQKQGRQNGDPLSSGQVNLLFSLTYFQFSTCSLGK